MKVDFHLVPGWHDVGVKRKRVLVIGAVCALIGAVVLIAWPRGPKEPLKQLIVDSGALIA